jgi:hypothetical protein
MRISETLNYFIPQPCPFQLVRVGGDSDGAYLLPNDMDGVSACFSPGVYNTKDFEDELALKFGINSHMLDFSSNENLFKTPLIPGMQSFDKKWLDTKNSATSITLEDWIYEKEGNAQADFILQMDIEGSEYRTLLKTPKTCIERFRIIVLEIHWLNIFDSKLQLLSQLKLNLRNLLLQGWLPLRNGIINMPSNSSVVRVVNRIARSLEPCLIQTLAQKIHQTHICVHAHPNNCFGEFVDLETGLNYPGILELTFLRRDRFSGKKNLYIRPQIPHPLDINNVKTIPPIHLNSKWTFDNKNH